MSYSYIGGADGPTSVFVAGKMGVSWLNIFGLIMVILLLVPNIIYAVKFRDAKNLCKNKVMNVLEQIGRYGSMFLMVFNVGLAEFGFSSGDAFVVYVLGSIALMLAYWIIWIVFFVRQSMWNHMALAIIPTLLFLLSGCTLRHVLLIVTAIIFGIGHIYVTYVNTKGVPSDK